MIISQNKNKIQVNCQAIKFHEFYRKIDNINAKALEAVENLSLKNKRIVFLSNAPRPSKNVITFLREMGLKEKFLGNVLTSGEAAIKSIKNNIVLFSKGYTRSQIEKSIKTLEKIQYNIVYPKILSQFENYHDKFKLGVYFFWIL